MNHQHVRIIFFLLHDLFHFNISESGLVLGCKLGITATNVFGIRKFLFKLRQKYSVIEIRPKPLNYLLVSF